MTVITGYPEQYILYIIVGSLSIQKKTLYGKYMTLCSSVQLRLLLYNISAFPFKVLGIFLFPSSQRLSVIGTFDRR